jgi:hypothetical protein
MGGPQDLACVPTGNAWKDPWWYEQTRGPSTPLDPSRANDLVCAQDDSKEGWLDKREGIRYLAFWGHGHG